MHRPTLLKIVDNIGWLFFDKCLRLGIGLFVGVWIARYLGPEQFGLLNFAIAFTGLFAGIATLGLDGILVREIVRDPKGAGVTLGTASLLQLISGLIAYLIIVVVIAYMRPDDTLARTIVAILGSMMMLKTFDVAVFWFESQVQSKYTVWVQNSVFLIFAVIKITLIMEHASIIAIAWAMLTEAVVTGFALFSVMYRMGFAGGQLSISAVRAKELLKDSWPLILSAISIIIYMRIDQIMLGQMVGDRAVGVYSAATRVSELWYFMPLAIIVSMFPVVLSKKQYSSQQYYADLQRLFDLMAVISLSVSLVITFLSNSIVTALFGDEFSNAGVVLSIHIWGSIFVLMGVVSEKILVAENLQILSLYRAVLGAIVNILLNLFLIPKYGVIGAAIATVIAQAIASLMADLLRKETRIIFCMKIKAFNFPQSAKRALI